MKQSGTTIVFVIVCIGVLVAAFVIGLCIRDVRMRGVKNESVSAVKTEKSAGGPENKQAQAVQMTGAPAMGADRELSPEDRASLAERRAGMRERFENMTEEEREQFRARMRERFSGRRRDMGPQLQLSEEERAKMREEIDALRKNWDQMSEAEREEAKNQISEKYGFRPRGLGSGRDFGDRQGDRPRPFMRPDEEQTAPDDEQTTPDDEQMENN